jgi:hypothetical protein
MELTNNELFRQLGDLDTKIIHELDNNVKFRLILVRNFVSWEIIRLSKLNTQ